MQLPDSRGSGAWFTHHQLSDGSHYVEWTGLFAFLIAADGRRILYRRLAHATRDAMSIYLLGQVLSFSLLALGIEPLHGTAVLVDGAAVVFLGDCGYGKSTLGAALLARGYPLITDDLVALVKGDGAWLVHPGVPRIKLFPDVARRVLGPATAGPTMNHRTSKVVLRLGPAQAIRRPVPVKACYVLSDPSDSMRQAGVDIESVCGSAAFFEVIRSSFNLIVRDSQRLANQFAFASRLVAGIPMHRLTYRRDLALLPALCDAVLADLEALGVPDLQAPS